MPEPVPGSARGVCAGVAAGDRWGSGRAAAARAMEAAVQGCAGQTCTTPTATPGCAGCAGCAGLSATEPRLVRCPGRRFHPRQTRGAGAGVAAALPGPLGPNQHRDWCQTEDAGKWNIFTPILKL